MLERSGDGEEGGLISQEAYLDAPSQEEENNGCYARGRDTEYHGSRQRENNNPCRRSLYAELYCAILRNLQDAKVMLDAAAQCEVYVKHAECIA